MMKTNMRFLIILATLGVVFVFASSGVAQAQDVPMVGGYKTLSVKDAGVVKATDFAVKKLMEISEMGIELVSVEKAEYQIVGGKNYRVCMQINVFDSVESMEADAESERGFVNAVIFQSLRGEYSLTSGDVVENCGKK